jgi:hypothetical protein
MLKKIIDRKKTSATQFLWLAFIAMFQTSIFDNGSAFAAVIGAPETALSGNALHVHTRKGEQTILLPMPVDKKDIHFEDLNFDGHLDLKILSSRGASQEFYSIYLYDPSTDKYAYAKQLSEVPCVQADVAKHQLIGACFHESACENWSERYSVTKGGRLGLLERDGTYCDESTGDAFSYIDRFKNGKRISSKVSPLKDGAALQ